MSRNMPPPQQSNGNNPPPPHPGSTSAPSSSTSSTPRRTPRPSKKVERPYPKGDIDVALQKKAQDLLLTAAQSFEGFNATNLRIIAVSFEHKTFLESTNREEYIRKIKIKLNDWHWHDTSNPPPGPNPSSIVSPNPNNKPNPSLHRSASDVTPKKENGSSSHHRKQSLSGRTPPNLQQQQATQQGQRLSTSPTLQHQQVQNPNQPASLSPMRPTFSPPYSPLMSSSNTFLNLTNMKDIDLNDPNIRAQWVNALVEYIYTEAYNSMALQAQQQHPHPTHEDLNNGRMDIDHAMFGTHPHNQQQQQQQHQHHHHQQQQQQHHQQQHNRHTSTSGFGGHAGQQHQWVDYESLGSASAGDLFGGMSDAQFSNAMMNNNGWMDHH